MNLPYGMVLGRPDEDPGCEVVMWCHRCGAYSTDPPEVHAEACRLCRVEYTFWDMRHCGFSALEARSFVLTAFDPAPSTVSEQGNDL